MRFPPSPEAGRTLKGQGWWIRSLQGETMDKLSRHALVAELVRAMQDAGSWCGRTHIQKTLFVFQALFEPEPALRSPFRLHMHGPYSFQLDDALDRVHAVATRRPPTPQLLRACQLWAIGHGESSGSESRCASSRSSASGRFCPIRCQ